MPPKESILHQACLHEDDFKRLESLVTKVFEKMDNFLAELHGSMIADAVREEKVARLEMDLSNLSTSLKKSKDEVKVLSDWRQRFEGGVRAMLAIPVFCTLVTTCIAIYSFW
jgi:hypothetical protein